MEFLVALLLGAVLYALWLLWRAGQFRTVQTSGEESGEDPPHPSARLLALSTSLAAAGEASSHPRDLGAHETFRDAVALLRSTDVPIRVVIDHATGANWVLAAVACAALQQRPDRESAAPLIVRQFRHFSPWTMYYALQFFASLSERPPMGGLVLHGPDYWTEHPLVPGMLAEHFATRAELGDPAEFGQALSDASAEELTSAATLLQKIDHPATEALSAALKAWQQGRLDREFLQTFGRFVESSPDEAFLLEHDAIREQLDTAESFIGQQPFRSVLVVGEPRVGKTSFLNLLALRAASLGWTVFEADAASLMAGQQYFGQLEERLRRLATELGVEKRVLWYIPDFLQLAASGTHVSRSASLLDQVLPAIASGRIVVAGETTPAGLTAILQMRPAMRSAIELIRLRQLRDAECDRLAHDVASRLSASTGVTIGADVTDSVMHLARHYLGTSQMPGSALDLLKLTVQRVMAHDVALVRRDDVLDTLSQLTGMPKLVLDDRERVELESIRKFFSDRVIGQTEAVGTVVDRIAMLKAGLTDPARPIAVYLFAGPTGTGKTELAKTLAEFLFGSADRLIRLDMSEFQAVDSTRKILGESGVAQSDGQALTDRVRRQPFSVVLLDEFEKANPAAWDLFLQVFDDGRLTDALGQTVDFRHCIIILTSNVGATIQQQAALGFGSATGSFSQDHVMRAVHGLFRPEFVNRLDAIIVFKPLTRELMRGILAKELARVLERRGLRHREWAVEWESTALDFLVEKGFSPTMGARPLKRAVDKHLLAPLAATLVEHRFPEGDQFLFVRSDGRGIQVEFVDPDAPAEVAPPVRQSPGDAGVSIPRLVLHATGAPDERATVAAALNGIEAKLAEPAWNSLERSFVERMQQPDFWDRPERNAILARYALMDRVKAALGTARGLEARLGRSEQRAGRYSRDLISRLALQLYLLEQGVQDVALNAPVEVVLSIQPALEGANDPDACAKWSDRLLDMYRGWASRRHMQWDELPRMTSPILVVVSGFGAARILGREGGLHVREYEGDRGEPVRAVARVTVAPTPYDLAEAPAERRIAEVLAALKSASQSSSVIRRYRLDGSPLVRDAQGWRTGREDLVLNGNFDLMGDVLAADSR